jgi:hypothetical protein
MDCGTPSFKCATDGALLFAVPVGDFSVGTSYFVHGAEFEVVDCAQDASCAMATVIQDCTFANPALCSGVTNSGVFLYSRERGIVAYGGIRTSPCFFGRDRFTGPIYWNGILKDQSGLLNAEFELPVLEVYDFGFDPPQIKTIDEQAFSNSAADVSQEHLRERFIQNLEYSNSAASDCYAPD